jgi:hypothetical protein
MTFYALALFSHISGVLALFAALSIEALSLYRLRRASTGIEALAWIDPVPRLPIIVASSGLLTVVSGFYLAVRMSAFGFAWLKIAVTILLLMAPFDAVSGRRIRVIRQACTKVTAIDGDLFTRLQDPFLRISLCIRVFIFLAVVLLMGAKPDLWTSISIGAIFVFLGGLVSLPGFRRASGLRTDIGR